ncbi:MAG: arginyltransferase [Pseudomonadota bacterium]
MTGTEEPTDDRNSIPLFLTPEHPCSYLEGEAARTLFVDPKLQLSQSRYQQLTNAGFRRSGSNLYRPHCERCQACQPSRIPVAEFQPRRRQRRIIKRNQDLELKREPARFTRAFFALYERYIAARHQEGGMYPADEDQYQSFLLCDWAESEFLVGYSGSEAVSIAVTDHLTDGLSAIYTFFEPTLSVRSLGALSILKQIEWARELKLDYLYLGYAIRNSPKMRYKFDYQPLEVLTGAGWQPCSTSSAANR